MMHKAWNSIEGVSCYFLMSSVKFQGHEEVKNWQLGSGFSISGWYPNSNSQMAMKRRGRDSLLFPKVIRQSSRSHGTKNRRFESDLGKITRPVAAVKSLRFAVLFSSLSCSLSDWWMGGGGGGGGGYLASDILVGLFVVWHGSGNFCFKEDSSMKISVEAHSISDALTW